MPRDSKADFFGDLFGNNASANTNTGKQPDEAFNSQSMELQQPNVSFASIIADKKRKTKDISVIDSLDSNTLSGNVLAAVTGPAGVSDGTDNIDASSEDISIYVVRDGDTVAKIADMYDVSANTILWANDLKKGDKLVKDTVLIILPVSGVKVTVTKGQTLKSLGLKYKVDPSDIADFNSLTSDAKLVIGDELIIPDGTMTDEGGDKPVKSSNTKKSNYYDTHKIASISGYFMNPMPGARLTQGLHDRGGIDLAASQGTPILAAADGTVIFARNGSNGGYGNMVVISHSNGTQTLYGHQSKIATTVGARVSQGDVIGYEGSTGHSTGPHLHFKVTGAQNPGAFLQIGSIISANWK